MKISVSKLAGAVKRNNETYVVEDHDYFLDNLTVSKTILHPKKCTSGHSHDDQEEVYFFIHGEGKIQLANFPLQSVQAGDIVLIEKGVFHKVFNDSETDPLIFVCVFEKYTRGEGEKYENSGEKQN